MDIDVLLKEATCENYDAFEHLLVKYFDVNDKQIDEIAFNSYSLTDSLLKFYDILLSHGYKIKNNIIFYILCVNLSYSIIEFNDSLLISSTLIIPNKFIRHTEFVNKLNKDFIIIDDSELSNLMSLDIKKRCILEEIDSPINPDCKIKFPKFINRIGFDIKKSIDYKECIKNILENRYIEDELDEVIIINYKDYKELGFNDFLKFYHIEDEFDVNIFANLKTINYYFDHDDFFDYFTQNSTSMKLFNWYMSNIKSDLGEKFSTFSIAKNRNLILLEELFKLGLNDPNRLWFDKIAIDEFYYIYDFDELDKIKNDKANKIYTYCGDSKVFDMYNIMLKYGYKFKNNIVIYMLCKNISWLATDINDLNTINELSSVIAFINHDEFKKYFTQDTIIITDNDVNQIMNELYMDEKEVIQLYDDKFNPECKIKFPKFVLKKIDFYIG